MSQHLALARTRRTAAVSYTVALLLAAGSAALARVDTAVADTPAGGTRYHGPSVIVPEGMVWIQGFVTDQAGHRLDNVNVEVWPDDPAATEPVASNLSYAGVPADARHAHGVFRVEVPMGQPYRIVFSGVGGAEDGDAFRMREYGNGKPLVVRAGTGDRAARGSRLIEGRVRNLGTVQLVHHGRVASRLHVKAPKVEVGERGKLRIRIASRFVRDVTGKVVVRVDGKRIRDRMVARDRGTMTTRLPRFDRAGTYKIRVRYHGSKTVKKAASKPVRIKVVPPKGSTKK